MYVCMYDIYVLHVTCMYIDVCMTCTILFVIIYDMHVCICMCDIHDSVCFYPGYI